MLINRLGKSKFFCKFFFSFGRYLGMDEYWKWVEKLVSVFFDNFLIILRNIEKVLFIGVGCIKIKLGNGKLFVFINLFWIVFFYRFRGFIFL